MSNLLVELLQEALHGKGSHADPVKALRGLSHETATQPMDGDAFTTYELLYHIVFWQDLTVKAAKGEEVNWDEWSGKDWPSYTEMEDMDWETLQERFLTGLADAERLVAEVDLTYPIPAWNNQPVAKAFEVLVTHNSYHLGQIVSNRKAQGLWPPLPEKDKD